MTIKILHVNFSFTLGGAELLMIQLSEHAPKELLCEEILIINDVYDIDLIKRLDQNRISYNLLKRPTLERSFVATLRCMWKTVKLFRAGRYDIVHCHTPGAVVWVFIAKLLSLRRFYTLLTVHGADLMKGKAYYPLTLIVNDVIAVSKAVLTDIAKINSKKGLLIYNGVSLAKFKPKELSFNSPVVLGNVARLCRKKGQDILIQATAELIKEGYDVQCWLIGEDSYGDSETAYLRQLAKTLNIEKSVCFKGKQLDVNSILDSVDIFVLPSRHEAFGLVLIEAMSKGIPTIASNLDGPKEVITPGENGLLFDGVQGLCNCVKQLIHDRDFAVSIAQKGMERAKEFTLEKMIEKYKEIYAGLGKHQHIGATFKAERAD